jgi:hypothetical protein
MRIVGIGSSAMRGATATRRTRGDRREPDVAETQGRALIAVEAAAPTDRLSTTTRYPAAPFLAQLIATHMQAPQTRARRRAELDEVIAAYSAMGPIRPVARCSISKML